MLSCPSTLCLWHKIWMQMKIQYTWCHIWSVVEMDTKYICIRLIISLVTIFGRCLQIFWENPNLQPHQWHFTSYYWTVEYCKFIAHSTSLSQEWIVNNNIVVQLKAMASRGHDWDAISHTDISFTGKAKGIQIFTTNKKVPTNWICRNENG